MSVHFYSAISRLRSASERRARTTAVATLAAAQNGTSGVLVTASTLGVGRLGPRREPVIGASCVARSLLGRRSSPA